jgi:hypothetical protein
MVPHQRSPLQTRWHSTCFCGGSEQHQEPLATWPLRRLAEEAARLYRSPEAQTLALLRHAAIMKHHATTQARRHLWNAFARALELDRAGARARREEKR